MKVIMVAVTSINGKITRGVEGNIYEWSSKEDQDHFAKLRDQNNLIVMGAGTYEAVKSYLKLDPRKLRIILSGNPNKYSKEKIPGQLEFTSEKPKELISRLSKTFKKMMLVGGSEINELFLKENLVDEINLTIEPVLFGTGKTLFKESDLEVNFRLNAINKLNKSGTILLKYSRIK